MPTLGAPTSTTSSACDRRGLHCEAGGKEILVRMVTEMVDNKAAMNNLNDSDMPRRHERLADFMRHNELSIVDEWTQFARTRSPASDSMTKLALQNHIALILKSIADDLDTTQTDAEQFDKSRGYAPHDDSGNPSVAEGHAALRLLHGFDIGQMVSEYRALRASITKLWTRNNTTVEGTDIQDLIRFNEAIDQALTESVAHHTKTISNSRNLFLGVLGHDLRNPITAVSVGGKMMLRPEVDDAKRIMVATEIVRATHRATQILDDLLDLARNSFGADIRVVKAEMDMARLCSELADELRTENGRIEVQHTGDTNGRWDKSRIGQAISNLMANALQHGDATRPVTVRVNGDAANALTVAVHNQGRPIAADKIGSIFKSWTSGDNGEGAGARNGTHLGLGLYIAKLFVDAHGGKIDVSSDEAAGTVFMICLPRS